MVAARRAQAPPTPISEILNHVEETDFFGEGRFDAPGREVQVGLKQRRCNQVRQHNGSSDTEQVPSVYMWDDDSS